MNTKDVLETLVKIANSQQKVIHKLAQMGAGVRVKFHHPQYFAKFAKELFENTIGNSISVEIYHDRVTFFDGSGSIDSKELHNLAKQLCGSVEQSLHLNHGELFNYDNLEP